jgi:hypothetical protein
MAKGGQQRTSLWQIWRQAEPFQRRNATLGGIVFLWAGLLYVSVARERVHGDAWRRMGGTRA